MSAQYASLVCVGVAAILALYGASGWGWFLFVAVLLWPTLT